MSGPIARRYWFADAAALEAIGAAEDAPGWEGGDLPVTIFCRDDASHEALDAAAGDDPQFRVIDARDSAGLAALVNGELDRETASYVQFAFHAVEDFGPAFDVLAESLAKAGARRVEAECLAIGPYATGEAGDHALLPERSWISADWAREIVRDAEPPDAAALQAAIIAMADGENVERITLITGACYLTAAECSEPTDAQREAALWRARTAAAWTEIDRLQSEKRIRAGREKALQARHERDLARQAERSAAEIGRLHRAAGWAGKWRARLGRLLGR